MLNQLAHEKSPYLLQHADNPVDWRPWGEAAFAQARTEQKPIFLSIGYSTCHWCHVMAHESFEDPAIARLLNEHFVSIKVDREERPDVDKVYLTYVQAMTGHGGWPLSVWLTPGLKPFYGGTYFPPEDRPGRMGFPAVLAAIARGWRDERDKLVAEGERVIGALRQHAEESASRQAPTSPPGGTLAAAGGEAFEKCFQHFQETFDAANGGFGGAPKFPRASNLSFLFRVAARQGVGSELGAAAVALAATTLRAMARGGIHDHVGGGFHRYAVDEAWFVPHFEKMLYDQAQIAMNCLEARQATGDERFAWMARDIFDYVLRDLTSPAGGFYTAEDADSALGGTGFQPVNPDHRLEADATPKPVQAEGAFYVWSADELRAALGGDFGFFAAHFGVEENGNVAAQLDPHGEFRGKNILAQRRSLAETAKQPGLTPEQANGKLVAALTILGAIRANRPRPHLDDKILTANNGLMISALARGSQVLGGDNEKEERERLAGGRSLLVGDGPPGVDELPASAFAGLRRDKSRLLQAATRAAEFVERELHDANSGMLYRTWRQGRGATRGFAEDYAFLIQGLLDLYEASFEIRWLQWAERLQTKMDELFWDGAQGGYFNSAAGDASIVLRLKEDYDGAEPAPSSVAAMNLLRLAAILNDPARRERGRQTIEAFRGQWATAPHAMPQMICALELALAPPRHVVIAGNPESADFRALAAVVHEQLGPRRILLAADGGDAQSWLAARAPWLADMKPKERRATAYVCEEFSCQASIVDATELRERLK